MRYVPNVTVLWITLAAIIAIGCGGAEKTTTEVEEKSTSDVESGERLFLGQAKPEVNCAACHESDGGAPNLANVVNSMSDEEILKAMSEGKGNMPGFSAVLLENEQQQILACIRARFTPSEPAPPSEAPAEE